MKNQLKFTNQIRYTNGLTFYKNGLIIFCYQKVLINNYFQGTRFDPELGIEEVELILILPVVVPIILPLPPTDDDVVAADAEEPSNLELVVELRPELFLIILLLVIIPPDEDSNRFDDDNEGTRKVSEPHPVILLLFPRLVDVSLAE
jgi:hypothetical protein